MKWDPLSVAGKHPITIKKNRWLWLDLFFSIVILIDNLLIAADYFQNNNYQVFFFKVSQAILFIYFCPLLVLHLTCKGSTSAFTLFDLLWSRLGGAPYRTEATFPVSFRGAGHSLPPRCQQLCAVQNLQQSHRSRSVLQRLSLPACLFSF